MPPSPEVPGTASPAPEPLHASGSTSEPANAAESPKPSNAIESAPAPAKVTGSSPPAKTTASAPEPAKPANNAVKPEPEHKKPPVQSGAVPSGDWYEPPSNAKPKPAVVHEPEHKETPITSGDVKPGDWYEVPGTAKPKPAVVHEPEHKETPITSGDVKPGDWYEVPVGAKQKSAAVSHTALATQPATEPSAPNTAPKVSRPLLEWDILKGILIIIAIIAIVALSLFYALSHNLFKSVTTTVLTTITVKSTSTTAPTTTIPMNSIVVQTGNASYVGNSIVKVSGGISPVPSSSGVAVLFSVTNPKGVQVVGAELPLSASGSFETSFVGGATNAWINGTYTITSNCCGLIGNNTFKWAPVPTPAPSSTIIVIICSIYTMVHNAIFLLCIMLLIFGAAMYALSNVMPGSNKNTFMNYGIGLMIGAMIAIIITVLAPYILRAIAGNALPIASCASKPF